MNPLDISVEDWREYVYADGFTYKVSAPAKLYVKSKPEGDSHRVEDVDGVVHYIPSGWRVIRWFGKVIA